MLSGLDHSDTAKIVKYKEDEDILEWLGSADHLAQHAYHCRHRISGTGGWLFEDEEFKNWKGMLLLHGTPGTSKTILASIVIDKVKPTAYYYCNYARQEQQTSKTILSCLLRQVVTKDPGRAGKLYEERTADIAAIKTALLESSLVTTMNATSTMAVSALQFLSRAGSQMTNGQLDNYAILYEKSFDYLGCNWIAHFKSPLSSLCAFY